MDRTIGPFKGGEARGHNDAAKLLKLLIMADLVDDEGWSPHDIEAALDGCELVLEGLPGWRGA